MDVIDEAWEQGEQDDANGRYALCECIKRLLGAHPEPGLAARVQKAYDGGAHLVGKMYLGE